MWPPFGKQLPAQLTLCSLCIMSIFSHFCFEGRIWVLIAPVPGNYFLVALFFVVSFCCLTSQPTIFQSFLDGVVALCS